MLNSIRLQAYRTGDLKAYFDQDALLFPSETIIAKTSAKDFNFFLDHGNFFKVVDTLEKFQQNQVNTSSQEGREFIMFKRQLYQMYEVKHRSVHEHNSFSFGVERRNLRWLFDANMDYISEMGRINHFEQLSDTSNLGGKVFKMKTLTPARGKGLLALGASAWAFTNMVTLTLMMGPTMPVVGILGATVYGMKQFQETKTISAIEKLDDGMLKFTIQKSPIVSFTITAHVNDCKSVCALGDDDLGADDVESNVLSVNNWTDSLGNVHAEGAFILPADAYRDKQMMEWILAPKSADEETAEDFHDLLSTKHAKRVADGGISLLAQFEVKQTGLANVNLDNQVDYAIENQELKTQENIRKLREIYGAEKLNAMSSTEFYKLYKHHNIAAAM